MKKFAAGLFSAAILSAIALLFTVPADAARQKSQIVKDFEPVCTTLDSLLEARTSVDGELSLRAVMKRGNALDFYFTVSLGDYPWHESDARWFRSELRKRLPDKYRKWNIGNIFSNGIRLRDLVTPRLGFDGSPAESPHMVDGHRTAPAPIVENLQKPRYTNGLDNRHIALWQSHGRYFEQTMDRWEWQRPCLFQTAEDLFTQSFVLPYLVPMLENAGAYVFLPRERDIQTNEIIVDNDPSFERIPGTPARGTGKYSETGKWKDAGTGFADTSATYTGLANPFSMGSARMAVTAKGRKDGSPEARWTPEIPEKGEYAVYVSYKSLPESTDRAEYTVRHLGGSSRFIVNQRIGGGTWIYLGTFMFDKGSEGYVSLRAAGTSGTKDSSGSRGGIITADAVRFGGGMGNIARKAYGDSTAAAEVSGLPRFVEGARYWMQWSGTDTTVYSQNEQKNDYMDDFMSRGAWVGWLSGGSRVNPDKEGLGIPVDLSFGFHSDAGVTPNDSTIGTLAIYTLRCEGSRRLPDGESRMTCREYADIVQSQIVRDLRAQFDPIWNRRSLWDRSYSESRTPPVPAMLLELMSHQNFSDMRYGLDPAFRFTVSRAVYKGILKYLGNRYGCDYVVQPLPVNSFAVRFTGNGHGNPGKAASVEDAAQIELSWKATADTLEPTAVPHGYILYTRIDSGAFDNGQVLKAFKKVNGKIRFTARIEPGHIYSYRITAWNSGGESFPSEILSVGIPADGSGSSPAGSSSPVLVVNNFSRISAPVSYDTPQYAGFDNRTDSGVPYIRDISFSGEMYQFRRDMPWTDDDNPGFGASFGDCAGKVIAGNTFDYPYTHGKAIMKAGRPFCSAGADAFVSDSTLSAGIRDIDLICGKQVTVKTGCGTMPDRYRVFTPEMQHALTRHAANGGNILVSGSKIATDIWDRVYEVSCDSAFRAESIRFAEKILGYRWITGYAGKTGEVKWSGLPGKDGRTSGTVMDTGDEGYFGFNTDYSSRIYRVEAPDGITPVQSNKARQESRTGAAASGTFLKYRDSNISAGTWLDTGERKVIAIGFPLETILQEDALDRIMEEVLDFFEN